MALPVHLKRGLRGEQLAAQYLRRNGYAILAANFSAGHFEADIIAFDFETDTVCVTEVKTRSPKQWFSPSDAVNKAKQERVKSSASAFLSVSGYSEYKIRFDIIEVIYYGPFTADINHIKNAF